MFCRDHIHEFSELQNPKSCYWSDEFQKITTFCRKIVLPGFWGTWLYQSFLFDLANTVLASKSSVETICMNSVGYRTHRAVTAPMSFKKITTFCRKNVLPGFWGTWLYQSTLFDLPNTVLASKGSVETVFMNSVSYRTQRAVTGPMSFKKSRRFCRKILLPGFWGTWLYQSFLFDLANTVLASKGSVETICMNSVGYRTHRAVTGPMSFKKTRRFVGKTCSRDFGARGCHPSSLIDIVHTALASKCSVKTICLISEGYRTHRAVTGPMSFKKNTTFCRKIVLPGFWGTWLYQSTLFDLANTVLAIKESVENICMNSVSYRTHRAVTGPMSFKKSLRFLGKSCSRVFRAPGSIKALYLTSQTLFWLVKGL